MSKSMQKIKRCGETIKEYKAVLLGFLLLCVAGSLFAANEKDLLAGNSEFLMQTYKGSIRFYAYCADAALAGFYAIAGRSVMKFFSIFPLMIFTEVVIKILEHHAV